MSQRTTNRFKASLKVNNRHVAPLYQREYVWDEKSQWEPLWNEIARLACPKTGMDNTEAGSCRSGLS